MAQNPISKTTIRSTGPSPHLVYEYDPYNNFVEIEFELTKRTPEIKTRKENESI